MTFANWKQLIAIAYKHNLVLERVNPRSPWEVIVLKFGTYIYKQKPESWYIPDEFIRSQAKTSPQFKLF